MVRQALTRASALLLLAGVASTPAFASGAVGRNQAALAAAGMATPMLASGTTLAAAQSVDSEPHRKRRAGLLVAVPAAAAVTLGIIIAAEGDNKPGNDVVPISQ